MNYEKFDKTPKRCNIRLVPRATTTQKKRIIYTLYQAHSKFEGRKLKGSCLRVIFKSQNKVNVMRTRDRVFFNFIK